MGDVYQEIREKVSLVEVASRYTELKQSGHRFVGLCPLHDEDTPSFHISEDKGVFYCFGCGKGGTVIDFLMEKEGLSIEEVPSFVQEKLGIELDNLWNFSPEDKKAANKQKEVLQLFVEYFNKPENREKAFEYLKTRIREDRHEELKKLIDELKIFFVPKENKFVDVLDDEAINAALELGILWETRKGYIVAFQERVVFPVFRFGKVIGLNGRSTNDEKKFKYLLSRKGFVFEKKNTLWGLETARRIAKALGKTYVYAVEGVIDALALLANGQPAVAYLGSSISIRQWSLLKTFDNVIIIPDSDEAGYKGAVTSIKNAMKAEYQGAGQILILPRGTDTADYLKEKTIHSLNNERVRTFEDFIIDMYVIEAKNAVPTSKDVRVIKSIFLSKILPDLVDVRHSSLANTVIVRIAQRLGVSPKYVYHRLDTGIKAAKEEVSKRKPVPKEADLNVSPVELKLMGAVTKYKDLAEEVKKKPWFELLPVVTRDYVEAVADTLDTKEDPIALLARRVSLLPKVRDKYFKAIALMPEYRSNEEAEEAFKEAVELLDIKYSEAQKAHTLLRISQYVDKMTKGRAPTPKGAYERYGKVTKKRQEEQEEAKKIVEKTVQKAIKATII